MDFVSRATVVKGSPFWMEKQTSCLEGSPHLVVLFDSTVRLCFYKRDHFLSLYNQFDCIHFPCPSHHINNWQNWLHRLKEISSNAVESSCDRQIASVYLTSKIQDLKYRSKLVPMRGRKNKQNRKWSYGRLLCCWEPWHQNWQLLAGRSYITSISIIKQKIS